VRPSLFSERLKADKSDDSAEPEAKTPAETADEALAEPVDKTPAEPADETPAEPEDETPVEVLEDLTGNRAQAADGDDESDGPQVGGKR